jgi:hypothetical protein
MVSNVIKQSRVSLYEVINTVVVANKTYNRRTSHINKTVTRKHNDGSMVTYGRMELDSHADTIVWGETPFSYNTRVANVM